MSGLERLFSYWGLVGLPQGWVFGVYGGGLNCRVNGLDLHTFMSLKEPWIEAHDTGRVFDYMNAFWGEIWRACRERFGPGRLVRPEDSFDFTWEKT